MNNQSLRCSVHMRSTKQSTLYIDEVNNELIFSEDPLPDVSHQPQHVYFLSNTQLKEGDYYISGSANEFSEIYQADIKQIESLNNLVRTGAYKYNKIIATTNEILGLPIIREGWLKRVFIPDYKTIKEVLLETTQEDDYQWCAKEDGSDRRMFNFPIDKLKVSQADNSVYVMDVVYDDGERIRLTPEILLSCGFEHVNMARMVGSEMMCYLKGDFCLRFRMDGLYRINKDRRLENIGTQIKYLYELQERYKEATGEELKLVNTPLNA